MEILNKASVYRVSGANGGGNYESFNNPRNYTGHTSYGGQGSGFVGTNSAGLDLGTILDSNRCIVGIASGMFGGSSSWANAIKGGIAGAVAGGCFSGGNGNGGGVGSNSIGGQCTW